MEYLTLMDLMGEDHNIWLCKNKKFGYHMEIDNEDGETIVKEDEVHPVAIEGFARFCKQFLSMYEDVIQEAA